MELREIIEGLKEYDSATVQNAMMTMDEYDKEQIDYSGPDLKSFHLESGTVVGIAVTCKVTPLYEPAEKLDWDEYYDTIDQSELPLSIGHLSAFMGNAGILLRAYAYARLLGNQGMHRVGEYATLNANYMAKQLTQAGFRLAYPERRATHEFIVTLADEARDLGVTAMDFAKRLLDYGFHAPTTYFPLLVPECLLIEPTETETREEIDGFVEAMVEILNEARETPDLLKQAPHTMPVKRLDDVKAARDLDLTYSPEFLDNN